MLLLRTVIHCILWASCVAIPLWSYYQHPQVYPMKRMNSYESIPGWAARPANNRAISRSYGYKLQPNRYEDAYNSIDGDYGVWGDESVIVPEQEPEYDAMEYQKLKSLMQSWQEQKMANEREDAYPRDPNTFYIQVDDDDQWERQPTEPETFEDLFESIPVLGSDKQEERTQPERDHNGMDMFQRIGMRLVDLTDETANEEAEQESEVADAFVGSKGEEPPLSQEAAESLLEQLQAVDEEGGVSDKIAPTEEVVGKEELETIFKKDGSQDKMNSMSAKLGDDKETGLMESDERTMGEPTVEELKEAERQILKEENRLLIEVIQRTPIELIRAPSAIEQVRALIGDAASRQEAIDYIESQLEVQ